MHNPRGVAAVKIIINRPSIKVTEKSLIQRLDGRTSRANNNILCLQHLHSVKICMMYRPVVVRVIIAAAI